MNYFNNEFLNDVIDKRIAVLGFGVSNIPLVRMLAEFKVCRSIAVYDKKSVDELGEEAKALSTHGVKFKQGFGRIDADIIFRSPGIRPDIDAISDALERGATLTSEMEAFLKYTPAMTFAITGSDGKTTTTTLTGRFLSEVSRTFVGGNIGMPLLDRCGKMTPNDCAVLELSSFQLMNMNCSPMNSAITNITPNHMDWHRDEDEYAYAKYNIVGENTKRLVVNAENEPTFKFGTASLESGNREVFFFSSRRNDYSEIIGEINERASLICLCDGFICKNDGRSCQKILSLDSIMLPGMHNVENYMTAIALTYGYVDFATYESVARNFFGVEHRLELVRVVDGVQYYNSSIDSSPTRTIAALSALEGRDIVVICGGYDKNLDYTPLAESLIKSARAVVLTGATANKIERAIYGNEKFLTSGLQVVTEAEFESAVATASELGRSGGCVVLSPASASFDRFKNFMERGAYFKELVNKL